MSSLIKPPTKRATKPATKPDYWRSLSELEGTPEFDEFLAREFPEQAELGPHSRRTFVQLMGASFAFAGLGAAGCRWDEDKIAPLSRRPEGAIPGMARKYNTTLERGGVATALRVTAYDGRPIKVDGNPDHPFAGKGTTAFDQASILDLYDPDRSRTVLKHRANSSFDDFKTAVGALDRAARLRILSEPTSSPTILRVRQALLETFPNARWHEYEPLSRDNEREGMRLAFGTPVRVVAKLAAARTILSLDGDFLADHPASLRYSRDFARGRRPEDGPMNRLYAVESTFSSAGALADHRLPLRSELVLPFLLALEAHIRGSAVSSEGFLGEDKVAKFLRALGDDLKATGRASLVLAGHRQPAEVHAIVARLHDALGAVGNTVEYLADPEPERPSHAAAIASLAEQIRRREVDALLILGGNPVFDAPFDLELGELLKHVPVSIHVSSHVDETSTRCTWHVPRTHYLEAWGDARAYDGTLNLAQPLIEPLVGGHSVLEVLAAFTGKAETVEALVRETFAALHPTTDWRTTVHDGFVEGSGYAAATTTLGQIAAPTLDERQKGGTRLENGALEVVFTQSSHCYDGRFANNGWLQETPDFMTRLTWDNVALVSPKTAEALGIANGALLRLTFKGGKVNVPAYVMPGQAPFSIGIALGHGRVRAGHVGGLESDRVESAGFDTYTLRPSDAMWIGTSLKVSFTGAMHPLAEVQDHWAIDDRGQQGIRERVGDLVKTTTAEELSNPRFEFEVHGPPLESLFARHAELSSATKGHRWGMATDLSTCIGCNACAVACQAENNVPIVGKNQVSRSREMHWIRIDRYFRGEPDDPQIAHQPVTCQHCESAPCEEVCPVGATVHSNEGLNEMVYNRCVGTRYCANNCPYKVRRFNFYEWRGHNGVPVENLTLARNDIRRLVFNPEVTVRSRGVMEKCSFCVQRVEKAKITATNEARPIADGEVQSACMEACPTDAIVFGDLADPESRVSKLHDRERVRRGYALLAELNTIPRNMYLAKVRNPNPTLTG